MQKCDDAISSRQRYVSLSSQHDAVDSSDRPFRDASGFLCIASKSVQIPAEVHKENETLEHLVA